MNRTNSSLIFVAALTLVGCASTSNTASLSFDETELVSDISYEQSGIAVRYPIGFAMSAVDGSMDSDHYAKLYEVLQFHKYSLKGWGKTHTTGVPLEKIENLDDTVNYSISSTLAKTQLIAHAVYENIKTEYPDSIIYMNPVTLDLSPVNPANGSCDTKKIQYMDTEQYIGSGEKFEDTFCYTIKDSSYQNNVGPASVYIDIVALNTLDMDRYWLLKNRSMGAEITPAITISKFTNSKLTSTDDFHSAYTVIDGTKKQLGDGSPFKCFLTACKKDKGSVSNEVISISEPDQLVQWENITESLKDVSVYAFKLAQKHNVLENHLEDLSESGFQTIPAVSFYERGENRIGLEALAIEYKYLDGSSKKFHQNFVTNSVPKIAKLIEVEKPIVEELLKETKKAQAMEWGTALLGVGLAAASYSSSASSQANSLAITQSMNMADMAFQEIKADFGLSVFDISEQLLPASDFSRNLTVTYDDNQFNLGQVRSIEDVRNKLREKL